MADEIPHNGAPLEVLPAFSPVPKVEERVVAEAGEAAQGIEADLEAKFEPEFKPEPLPLRVQHFDPTRYHPCTHILPPGGIRRFRNFARSVPEDLLMRDPVSHLSSNATEGESRAYRGYEVTTARDWYDELPAGVCDIVDETDFGLFYSGLTRVIASRPLLGALVERWKMTMTRYDFAMITGLGVGGDPIPFYTDMGNGSEPETLEEMEQYARGFLMFVLGTTLFLNRWNIGGLYLLSALVTFPRLWVYAYFPALAPEPMEELPPMVPYSWRYDGLCQCRSRESFTFFRYYFNTVAAREIMWQPWAMMLAKVRDQYTGAWATSHFQILLEGPVCRT
ncbi:hypothetical protein CsSME_00016008 [Camellia sinensis var. sinensis]